ncbi:transcriptional regulator [Clostridium sp. 2-1]|uniref:helix-turn-helix domain-containing protein n=1 Tax=Clostridium TaxID=1485 RepID=UPI000CDB22C6|nr:MULTISPECIES: helix-turn-helix transcriptional regulator [Clostridium]MBN7576042.1 helix-turn-helix transcriptional regulator [Clostridium beijerinckii]MBN7581125.1 helix-turn-helix transcriptional regulator [Clostridium beijerinckii]MBN7585763.1 helix-turn-helix transcriptional regulator [Clostridium beijerinckii]MBO0521552.1 helix-turn-helix transcriptional regulator [Clostridium beijerinckii]POO90977.1 transcriptional regulator [Clostridium sp. 2-1]
MIRRRRKEKKFTQRELASQLRIRDTYISQIENHPESCNPTLDIILGLAKYLKITPYKVFDYFIMSRKNNKHK